MIKRHNKLLNVIYSKCFWNLHLIFGLTTFFNKCIKPAPIDVTKVSPIFHRSHFFHFSLYYFHAHFQNKHTRKMREWRQKEKEKEKVSEVTTKLYNCSEGFHLIILQFLLYITISWFVLSNNLIIVLCGANVFISKPYPVLQFSGKYLFFHFSTKSELFHHIYFLYYIWPLSMSGCVCIKPVSRRYESRFLSQGLSPFDCLLFRKWNIFLCYR